MNDKKSKKCPECGTPWRKEDDTCYVCLYQACPACGALDHPCDDGTCPDCGYKMGQEWDNVR